MGAWEFEFAPEAEKWYMQLGPKQAKQIRFVLDELERHGPRVRRPLVGKIKGSRHHNMKELRSVGGNIRVLFAFDPQRRAIMLLGGDKTNDWEGWYKRNIPVADRRYDDHLRSLGKEGPWQARETRAGARSAHRGR
jgi:hypothetical protein